MFFYEQKKNLFSFIFHALTCHKKKGWVFAFSESCDCKATSFCKSTKYHCRNQSELVHKQVCGHAFKLGNQILEVMPGVVGRCRIDGLVLLLSDKVFAVLLGVHVPCHLHAVAGHDVKPQKQKSMDSAKLSGSILRIFLEYFNCLGFVPV